ncbi:phage tail length tape measure family protein [Achromobacter denitrificans]|uniref:Phage tail length tape measure family protein n=2 Tax=Achromobacter denitrificans TaxID=32002 RepID=A0A6N0JDU7_ACHDE|nr:phage tail length tape measure family protein [Achromobacter denitrificans]QKQ45192.1 phage tail length tape measure family protein [Achromobacter denitrificans]
MSKVIAEGVVAVTGDTSGLSAAMADVAQETGKAKKSLDSLGRGASSSLNKAADSSSQATKKIERSTQSLIGQIERQIAVTEAGARGTAAYYQEIAKQRGIDANQLKPYLDQLNAVTAKQGQAKAALAATEPVMQQLGMSAKATAAAMRGVPAQFTDIITSLQGGQRPMTVMLQQGGQLKDMFGGIGPAARAMGTYIRGLISPMTLAAGAVAALGVAYYKGTQESQAYSLTLIKTGNAVGTTAGQLQIMSERIGAVAGTQSQAAAALNVFAGTAKVGAQNLEGFTAAAIRWEKATGTAVSDTAKAFEDLGKAPLEASLKLNEGMNYLTASTYEQIRALDLQGRSSEAAAVAQKAYADALNDRSPKITSNLGTLERAWAGVQGAAKGAWDAMLDIGRPSTAEDAIAKMEREVRQRQENIKLARQAGATVSGKELSGLDGAQAELGAMLAKSAAAIAAAQAEKKAAEDLAAARSRAEYVDDPTRNTKPQQRAKAIEAETNAYRKAVAGLAAGTEEYRKVYAAHQAALDDIEKRFEDKGAGKGPSATDSEAARLRARIAEEKALAVELAERGLQTNKLNEHERRAAEIGELLQGNLKGAARAGLERTQALAAEAGALARANKETAAFLDSRAKYMQGLEEGVGKISLEAAAIEDQVATYGLSKAALERLTIARLYDRKATLAGFEGSEREIELIEEEISARERLVTAIKAKDVKDAQKKIADDAARDWERSVDKYGDVFRIGFADMLNNGKEGWKSFTKSLTTTFKTTVADQLYKMFAQPFVVSIVANLAGLTGGASSAGGALSSLTGSAGQSGSFGGLGLMNVLGLAKTAYGALTGGITASLASGISTIGSAIGSTAATQFALGMTGQGATLAAGLAGPTTAGSAAASAGSMAAGAIPVVGWIAAGMMASRSLYKQGWDAGNGTMAPIAKYNPITGPSLWTDKVLRAVGVKGEWASMLSGSSTIARLFGMKPKEYGDTSIVGDFGTLGFMGHNETPWTQKGGVFRSNKKGVQYGSLDNEFMDSMTASFELMKFGVGALADSIGVSSKTLDTYSERIKVTLTKDAEENQKLIDAMLQSVGENMVRALIPDIERLAAEGESAGQALARLSESLGTVNSSLKLLRRDLLDVSLAGAETATKVAAAFGGLENLTSASQAFYEVAYTEGERAKYSLASISESLESVGIEMPNTMKELSKVALALDLTTDAGRAAYATLISLGPAFAAAREAAARAVQEAAAAIFDPFVGRSASLPALSGAALAFDEVSDSASGATAAAGYISRLFLILDSGLIQFNGNLTSVSGELTAGQEASALLGDQIADLRAQAGGAIIDFAGLGAALAAVDTDTFVATMAMAFQNLASRFAGLMNGINAERVAVRDAARGIIDAKVMTPQAIAKEIAGVNTVGPSNAGLIAAAGRLSAADALAAQRVAERKRREDAYDAVQGGYDSATSGLATAQQRVAEAQALLDKLNWDIYAPKTVGYKKKNWAELDAARSVAQSQMPAAQAAWEQAQAALRAAEAAAAGAPALADVARLQAEYAASVTAAASAQAAATEAAANAKSQQTAYADALQKFALDATKSVSRLGELRAETVRYYEAQKALAGLMAESASGLRKSVSDYRYSQLSPEEQFASLQGDYAKAYASAMGSDGEALAGYADKLNALMQPMLEAAKDSFSSDAAYQAFVATALARAEAVAGRLDSVAPKDYAKESLDLLAQIDATLAALETSALSGEQVITNAINASRDATVNGLRQVVNALTGQAVAAFAKGGDHAGGLRLVGERGPELEVTGPSRIFSAERTQAILSGGGNQELLLAELRALRQSNEALRAEVASLRIEARATASNTGKTARQLDRLEMDGMVVRTEAGAPLQVEGT